MTEEVQGGLPDTSGVPVTETKTGFSVKGTTALGPTETEAILRNMQGMIDERTGPLQSFLGGLKDASAWATMNPSQATAVRDRQKQLEDEQIMGMREKMAMYRTAQAQQEQFGKKQVDRFSAAPSETTTGTKPTTPPGMVVIDGVPMPAAYANALRSSRSDEEYKKIWNERVLPYVQKMEEMKVNPELDVPKVPVVVRGTDGNPIKTMISVNQWRQQQQAGGDKYQKTSDTDTALKSTGTDTLAAVKRGVYSQESTSGQADTSKPNYAGAVGPMQVTQSTFDKVKNLGLIPQTHDINNPEHNIEAGQKLLGHYHNKYNGDVDKMLAAYYGGEGAINKDGTINLDQRDPKNPKAPTVGQYIEQVKQKAGLGGAPTQVAGTTVAMTPEEAEQKSAIRTEYQKNVATEQAKNVEAEHKEFQAAINPNNIREFRVISKRNIDLITKNKDVIGILNDPTTANGIAIMFRDGVTTPWGSVGFHNLEDALARAIPGTTTEAVNARDELKRNFTAAALRMSKTMTGQGAVSNFERDLFERVVGSLSQNPGLLLKIQEMNIARANLDERLGKAYKEHYKPGQPIDYQEFKMKNPEYDKSFNDYEKELTRILGTDMKTLKPLETARADLESAQSKMAPNAPSAGTTKTGVKWSY